VKAVYCKVMRRLISLLLTGLFLLLPSSGLAGSIGRQQADRADGLLQLMTPEERVGQLFLVSFKGNSLLPNDPISELVTQGRISGVVLASPQDNFVDAPDTVSKASALTRGLQQLNYDSSQAQPLPGGGVGRERQPVYIPLLIGIRQDSGGPPYSDIYKGLTSLPTEMAIGATWDVSLAESVGQVEGRELTALGINLLLGPSLDVLDSPQVDTSGDLGAGSFGGDPYWVSIMGQAFIRGLHDGSNGMLAVVAKHFPGHGGSDRPLEEEVATVRKSLEELKRIELAPFFAVTGSLPGSDSSVTDGLLTSHIRYQGFQGNIRATTRPVSLDPQAFAQLMSLEPLASWRQGGGVTVSDSLGSRAVRRFYDPKELTFKGLLVARDAFLAGNDLLFLSDFRSSGDPDELTSIKATLAFFAQKYRDDTVFAQQVDAAVLRILRLKLRVYGEQFDLGHVLPPEGALASIGAGTDVTLKVARAAATLLSPPGGQAEAGLAAPPELGQRMVFFTDSRAVQQCSTCQVTRDIDPGALENAILNLYGPRAAGQVGGWNLISFSMADLAAYLDEPPTPTLAGTLVSKDVIGQALNAADWLIFSITRSSDAVYGSSSLKLLLERRPDLARSKRLVVFALNIPYDLDATDISKLDLYYGLYSATPPFIDVAARLLFQEISAPGASPVSVPGIGYDLIRATGPDPNQIIQLSASRGTETTTQAPTPQGYVIGDVVRLSTGIILDTNGHPVPDGTPVEFSLGYPGENIPLVLDAETTNGWAQSTLTLDQLGLLTIAARSDPARTSQILQLDVQEGIPAFITVIAPTSVPSETPLPSITPEFVATEATQTTPGTLGGRRSGQLGAWDLLLGLLSVGLVTWGGNRAADRWLGRDLSGHRRLMLALLAGLLGYNYLALGLPGSAVMLRSLGVLAAPLAGALGAIALLGLEAVWRAAERRLATAPLGQTGDDSDQKQQQD
jgi:beta-N-acetylhexosaminidase